MEETEIAIDRVNTNVRSFQATMRPLVLAAALAAASSVLLTPASELSAQAFFSVDVGAFAPLTTFEDPSFGESNFESAVSIGFSAGAWFSDRFGVRAKVMRSQTDGANSTSEFAPIAVNDPNQYTFSAELTARQPMDTGSIELNPYIALGAGMRHYTWAQARSNEDKFFALTGALGAEIRPAAFGDFGLIAELRGYRSQFKGFGIHGGNWRPGDELAREEGNIGFYGGVVDLVWSHDMLFTLGVSYNY